jgi:hypothetical protein
MARAINGAPISHTHVDIGSHLTAVRRLRSQTKKYSQALPNFSEDFDWSGCCELDATSAPIQIFHVVGENDTRDLAALR